MKVYLAGPEVFLPDGREIIERKRELCRRYGFEPSRRQGDFLQRGNRSKAEFGRLISQVNETLIRESHLLIANLTPFRGISADPGTVFELGFMCALDRPVFGYTNTSAGYLERVSKDYFGGEVHLREDDRWIGSDGHLIEDHEMVDNLMIDGGIYRLGGTIIRRDVPRERMFTDLTAYEECLRIAQESLLR